MYFMYTPPPFLDMHLNNTIAIREDTHKKSVFFSGRTTKGVGRGNPPDHLAKKHFFSINGENSPGSCIMKILFYEVRHFSPNFHEFTALFRKQYFAFFSPKIGEKKNCQNPFKAIIRLL
jgi:hypothetical protein